MKKVILKMIKVLNSDLKLYFNNQFPYRKTKYFPNKRKSHTITIGIGGNIGNVIKRFKQLLIMLKTDSRLMIESSSPILKNPPFGFLEQDDFMNAIIVLRTNLSPIESLNLFQRYEYRFKRTRSFQDAPRTLDIDIIFYDNIKMDTKRLTIPHKGYKNRLSVLIPLKFIPKQKYVKMNTNREYLKGK